MRAGKESYDTTMIVAKKKKGKDTATGEKSDRGIIPRMICRVGSMSDHELVRNHLGETISPVDAILGKCWMWIL